MLLRYYLSLFKRKHPRFTLGEFISWQQHLSTLDPSVGRTVTPFLLSPLSSTDRPTTDGPNKSCPLAPPDARPLPPTTPPTPTLPPNKHPSSHSLSPLHSLPMALPPYPGQNTLRKGGRGSKESFVAIYLPARRLQRRDARRKRRAPFSPLSLVTSFSCSEARLSR